MKFYIATSLDNAAIHKRLTALLVNAGHELTYDWTAHGSVQSEPEERRAEVAEAEILGVEKAEILIVYLPGGRGTHTELGVGLGAPLRDGYGAPVRDGYGGSERRKIVICGETPDALLGGGGGAGGTCVFYHFASEHVFGDLVDIATKILALMTPKPKARRGE